jgi:hypothetical protein
MFLKLKPAFNNARDKDAGCALTPVAPFSLAASSDIVISGSALTHPIKTAI